MNKKIFLLLSVLVGLPTYALAGLGGTVDSFKNDSTPATVLRHVVLTTSNSTTNNYSTQQMHDDAGNLITEYVTTNGVVFALTWRGLFKPDLHQLLGNYFKTYLDVEGGSSGRQTQVVDQDSVVVVSEGRLRNFHGKAYIPALVPNGFSLDDLK
ncbi:MAG: DUF2844 domain-containing protein [Gammaproteobacteria bacterium]|nr:DUF2844 domain-containing protein [Gammaproteobacteria bacterium]